jgi:hypothetical protein
VSFTIDTSAFSNAIEFVQRATGRVASESLNRGARTVVIGAKGVKGAMQLTPKASKARIQAVSDRQLRGYVIRKAGRRMTRQEIDEAVKKERKRRKAAAGYTAFAGWSNAAKAFGGKGVRGVTSSTKKLARYGTGTKATPAKLIAELLNTAPAAEDIGTEALQTAVNNAAADLVAYGTRKLQEAADRAGL